MKSNRYDRQTRIQGWEQSTIEDAKIMVVGAGALGNELIKNLMLLGVGNMVIIDFDTIEPSNLSRTILFNNADVEKGKAEVAAKAAKKINPDVNVSFIQGNVFYDLGLGVFRHANIVVSGLDNMAARSFTGINSKLAGIPFLDGGMWAMGGEVRWFLPGDEVCFECTLTEADQHRAFERRSCTGFKIEPGEMSIQTIATNINTASIIGGLLSQEIVKYLFGWQVNGGHAIVYNGLSLKMHVTSFSRDPNCAYHQKYEQVTELDAETQNLTAAELLAIGERDLGEAGILELGRDFLLRFDCPQCYRRQEVNELLRKVIVNRTICPHCGTERTPLIISDIGPGSPFAHYTLSQLGVPLGEVLAFRTRHEMILYEMSGDIRAFWPS